MVGHSPSFACAVFSGLQAFNECIYQKKNGELDTADSSYAWLTQICWQPQKEIHRAGKHGSFTLSFLIFDGYLYMEYV